MGQFNVNMLSWAARKLFFLFFRKENKAIRYVHTNKLTYCSRSKLKDIAIALNSVRKRRIPGIFIEAGVALGGSAVVIAKCKDPSVPLHLYDVFGMIPPPSFHDGKDAHRRFNAISSGASEGIGDEQYYGYHQNLRGIVVSNIQKAGLDLNSSSIRIYEGLFENTMILSEKVAFAHIDADWYESVRTCIERISPALSVGGYMIFDDYRSYSGCRKAVDEFLAANSRCFRMVSDDKSAVVLKSNS